MVGVNFVILIKSLVIFDMDVAERKTFSFTCISHGFCGFAIHTTCSLNFESHIPGKQRLVACVFSAFALWHKSCFFAFEK